MTSWCQRRWIRLWRAMIRRVRAKSHALHFACTKGFRAELAAEQPALLLLRSTRGDGPWGAWSRSRSARTRASRSRRFVFEAETRQFAQERGSVGQVARSHRRRHGLILGCLLWLFVGRFERGRAVATELRKHGVRGGKVSRICGRCRRVRHHLVDRFDAL